MIRRRGALYLRTMAVDGSVNIDGSSTVFPITEAMAEEFQKARRVSIARFDGDIDKLKKIGMDEVHNLYDEAGIGLAHSLKMPLA